MADDKKKTEEEIEAEMMAAMEAESTTDQPTKSEAEAKMEEEMLAAMETENKSTDSNKSNAEAEMEAQMLVTMEAESNSTSSSKSDAEAAMEAEMLAAMEKETSKEEPAPIAARPEISKGISLKFKMIGGMSAILLAALAAIGYGIWGSNEANKDVTLVKDITYPNLDYANTLLEILKNTKGLIMQVIEETDEDYLETIADNINDFTEKSEEMQALAKSDQLKDITERFTEYSNSAITILKKYLKEEDFDAISGDIGKFVEISLAIEEDITSFREDKYKTFTSALIGIQKRSDDFIKIFSTVGIILISIVIAIIILTVIMIKAIKGLVSEAGKLSSGDLENEIKVNRSDELGILQNTFEGMRINLKDMIDNLDAKVQEKTKELEEEKVVLQKTMDKIEKGMKELEGAGMEGIFNSIEMTEKYVVDEVIKIQDFAFAVQDEVSKLDNTDEKNNIDGSINNLIALTGLGDLTMQKLQNINRQLKEIRNYVLALLGEEGDDLSGINYDARIDKVGVEDEELDIDALLAEYGT